eukprot:10552861-Prorocentrum_lima.AAC.1
MARLLPPLLYESWQRVSAGTCDWVEREEVERVLRERDVEVGSQKVVRDDHVNYVLLGVTSPGETLRIWCGTETAGPRDGGKKAK